jgi:hypothetical protein
MPVYSLIALVLSIFGATYTAIAALRNHFDDGITSIHGVVDNQLVIISKAGKPSEDTANGYGDWIKKWYKIWKWSHIVPIIFFWIVAFGIGICSLFWWDKITQPIQVTISPSGTAVGTVPAYIESVCRKGWWILFVVIFVNGLFSLSAVSACIIIKNRAKHLCNMYNTAVGVLANKDLQAAAIPAAPVAAPPVSSGELI